MYDFLKLDITDAIPTTKLLLNELLDFHGFFSRTTGDIFDYKIVAIYKSCKFIVYKSGRKEFQGSLHKLLNDGVHNFNDFSFDDFLIMLDLLKRDFEIDLDKALLRNVEFGVNIKPLIESDLIIDNLLIHRAKRFEAISIFKASNYKQVRHNRYLIKIYNKQLQYSSFGIENELLRLEVKYKKMHDLNLSCIRTLDDLTKPEILDFFIADLDKKLSEIIMYDPTLCIDGKEWELKLSQWSNSNFWINLKKSKRHIENRNYRKVVNSFSNRIQDGLLNLVSSKCLNLRKNSA